MKHLKLGILQLSLAATMVMGSQAHADANPTLVEFIRANIESVDRGLAAPSAQEGAALVDRSLWIRILAKFSMKYQIIGVSLQPEVELGF